jgi:orotate phosphoribosyltransferase
VIEYPHKQKLISHFYAVGAFLEAPPGQPFKLASGRESAFYVDCCKLLLTSKGVCLAAAGIVNEICRLLAHCDGLPQAGPWAYVASKGVGGLALLGGILGHASAKMLPIRGLAFRDQPKDHGTRRYVEGPTDGITTPEQMHVPIFLVDDVLTSGGTALEMTQRLYEEFQLKPSAILFVVDRQEGGYESITEKLPHTPVRSMLTVEELRSWTKPRTPW